MGCCASQPAEVAKASQAKPREASAGDAPPPVMTAVQVHQELLRIVPVRDEQYAERDALFEKLIKEAAGADAFGATVAAVGHALLTASGFGKGKTVPPNCKNPAGIVEACARNVVTLHSAYKNDNADSCTAVESLLVRRSDMRLLLLHVERYYAVLAAFETEGPTATRGAASDPLSELANLTVDSFTRRFDAKVRAHLGVANWPAPTTAALLRQIVADVQQTGDQQPAVVSSLPLHQFALWASNLSLEREARLGEDALGTVEPLTPVKDGAAIAAKSANPLVAPPPPEPTEEELLQGAAVLCASDASTEIRSVANDWVSTLRSLLPVDDERTSERQSLMRSLTSASEGTVDRSSSIMLETLLMNKDGASSVLRNGLQLCNVDPERLFFDSSHLTLAGQIVHQHIAHFLFGKSLPNSFILRCYLYAITEVISSYLELVVIVSAQLRRSHEAIFEDYRRRYREWKRRQLKRLQASQDNVSSPRNDAPKPPEDGVSNRDVSDAIAGLGNFLSDELLDQWLREGTREVSLEEWRVVATRPQAEARSAPAFWPAPLRVDSSSGGGESITMSLGLHYVAHLALRPMLPHSLVWEEAQQALSDEVNPHSDHAIWRNLRTAGSPQPRPSKLLFSQTSGVAAAPTLWKLLVAKQLAKSSGNTSAEPLVLLDTAQAAFQEIHPAAAALTQALRGCGLGNVLQRAFAKAMCIAGGGQYPDPALTSEFECDLFARTLHGLLDSICKISDIIHVYWDELSSRSMLLKSRKGSDGTAMASPAIGSPHGSRSPSLVALHRSTSNDMTSEHSGDHSPTSASVADSNSSLPKVGPSTRKIRMDALLFSNVINATNHAAGSHVDVALANMRLIFAGSPLLTGCNDAGGWSDFNGLSVEDLLHCLCSAASCTALFPQGQAVAWRQFFRDRIPQKDSAQDERKRYLLWRELQMRQLQSSSGNRPSSGRDFNKIGPTDFLRFVHGRLPLIQLLQHPSGTASGHQSRVEQIIRDSLNLVLPSPHTPMRSNSSSGIAASSPSSVPPPRPPNLGVSKENVHDVFLYISTYLNVVLNSSLTPVQLQSNLVDEGVARGLLKEMGVESIPIVPVVGDAGGAYDLDALAASAAKECVSRRHRKEHHHTHAAPEVDLAQVAGSSDGAPSQTVIAIQPKLHLWEQWRVVVSKEGYPIQPERKLAVEDKVCRALFAECNSTTASFPRAAAVDTITTANEEDVSPLRNPEGNKKEVATPLQHHAATSVAADGQQIVQTETAKTVVPPVVSDVIAFFKSRWPMLSTIFGEDILDRILRASFAAAHSSEQSVSPHSFRRAAVFVYNCAEICSEVEAMKLRRIDAASREDEEGDDGARRSSNAVDFSTFADVWLEEDEVASVLLKFDLTASASEDLFDILLYSKPPPRGQFSGDRAVNATVLGLWGARVMDVQYAESGVQSASKASTRWQELRQLLHFEASEADRVARADMFAQADTAHRNALSLAEMERFLAETIDISRYVPQLRPVLFRAYEATMEHRRLVLGDDELALVLAGDSALKNADKISFPQFRHFLYYVYEYACLYYMFDALIAASPEASRKKILPKALFLSSLSTLRAWGYNGGGSRDAMERAFIRLGGGQDGGVDAAVFNEFAEWASDEGLRVDI